jgi:hypothetical protein
MLASAEERYRKYREMHPDQPVEKAYADTINWLRGTTKGLGLPFTNEDEDHVRARLDSLDI